MEKTSQQILLPLGLQRDLLEMAKDDLCLKGNIRLEHLYSLYDILPLTDPDSGKSKYISPSDDMQLVRKREVVIPRSMQRQIEKRGRSGLLFEKMDIKLEVRAASVEVEESVKDDLTGTVIKRGKSRHVFPGVREDRVEHALRKLAIEGQVIFDQNGSVGVRFTLGDVQRILKSVGGVLSKKEIKEAILILGRSEFRVTCQGDSNKGRVELSRYGYRLRDLQEVTIDAYRSGDRPDEGLYHSVIFHDLIAQSIRENDMRSSNFAIHAQLSNLFARMINKELRMNFTWASNDSNAYVISLKHVMLSLGRRSRGMSQDARDIRGGIDELVAINVLRSFDMKVDQLKITDGKSGSAVDYEFMLWPSDEFVQDMIRCNQVKKSQNEKVIEFLNFKEQQKRNCLSESKLKLLRDILDSTGMKEETARKLLVENSDDYIKGCLATTLERMRMNEVRSPSHYFAAIVKSGLVKQTQLDFGQEDTISDKLLCRFSEEEQSFLRAIWDHLNSGDRLNIERYGLSSGHIKMMFEDWTRKQKRLKAK